MRQTASSTRQVIRDQLTDALEEAYGRLEDASGWALISVDAPAGLRRDLEWMVRRLRMHLRQLGSQPRHQDHQTIIRIEEES